MLLARIAAVAGSIVVCAWFALGIRQAHDTSQASGILSPGTSLTAPQVARTRSLLDAAGTLNPDTQVDLLRAELLLRQGRTAAAQQKIESVTRSEPRNIQAWLLLAQSAFGNGPLITRALHAIDRLDPFDARPIR